MPYRAPELFNVETDIVIDDRIDIWVWQDNHIECRITQKNVYILSWHHTFDECSISSVESTEAAT